MAEVVSVSVPENLHRKLKQSNRKDISPSALFQTALETELDNTNRHLVYWSQRALNAEKKLQMIQGLIDANASEIKKLLLLQNEKQSYNK